MRHPKYVITASRRTRPENKCGKIHKRDMNENNGPTAAIQLMKQKYWVTCNCLLKEVKEDH